MYRKRLKSKKIAKNSERTSGKAEIIIANFSENRPKLDEVQVKLCGDIYAIR